MAADAVEKWAEHGSFHTRYLEAGEGPPVLLLHGSGPGASAWVNWRGVLTSSLASRYRLLAPDIAGFGETDWAGDEPAGHGVRMRQVRSLVAALDLPPGCVVGSSVGGALALGLAYSDPSRVDRIALVGTLGVGFEITPALDQVWGYQPSLQTMAEVMATYAYDQSVVTDDLVRARYEASIDADAHERYAAAFAAPRQRHLDDMSLTEDALRSIDARTLLVHGAEDVIVPMEATSLKLVKLLPRADLVVFSRCGHWVHMERAADLQRQLESFLDAR